MKKTEHAPRSTLRVEAVDGDGLSVHLKGRCTFDAWSPSISEMADRLTGNIKRLKLVDAGIDEWDSALPSFLLSLHSLCTQKQIELDLQELPEGVQQLVGLATAVPERKGARRSFTKEPLLERIGKRTLHATEELTSFLRFIGELTGSLVRFVFGRARYRPAELWLTIQQCGPQALGIVTTISVLVGAILAFVGAIQLKMFGAEIYVANLVSLGMVIEMGALMTGIILAGRTVAAFAAQLGTMQVNEEIDALQTLGIPPMDYLVLPRVVALAVMTPLLVVYADILGILGGAAIGIFALDIPPKLFFNQAFGMMTLWYCVQGLIKGSTFGVLVAMTGCLRGMQCGRSASAVGDAATSAVVTSIVLIVLADAVWTFVFMFTGG
ncbi:MAG TPA: ABC transporter permease [Pontiella sp.]|nr:ABC transporter permease [Pontiella sp.]